MKYLLDTHAWIWWNLQPDELSRRARSLLDSPKSTDELLLSAISPWELSHLLRKGRIRLFKDPEAWIQEALGVPMLRLVPLSPMIAYRSTILPGTFHGDPADQIIVATAREEGATVVTKDRRIRDYGHVPSIW